jgi:hypothetical protein
LTNYDFVFLNAGNLGLILIGEMQFYGVFWINHWICCFLRKKIHDPKKGGNFEYIDVDNSNIDPNV